MHGAKVNAKEDKGGLTPLHYAAGNNSNPDVVKALISAGAKVNAKEDKDGSDSFACLQHLSNSNPDVVKALISAGAKVNAKDDKDGQTPLHACSIKQLKPRCSKSSYQCRC